MLIFEKFDFVLNIVDLCIPQVLKRGIKIEFGDDESLKLQNVEF